MWKICPIVIAISLAGCDAGSPPPKGERGEVGAVGPAGPPGADSAKIRMITAPCQSPVCAAACNEDEQILNAFALNPGGALNFEDERHLTFRPRKNPTVLVLACIGK
jgi:hypothetical protein